MRSLGIVLVVVGLISLIYTGFTFTTKDPLIDAVPIQLNKQKKHSVSWPPIAGAVLLVSGIVLILTNKK